MGRALASGGGERDGSQPHAGGRYLDPATLARVGRVDLRARMVVEGVLQGQHRSPYQGISVEFAQHRQYVPGDELRHLDWKVYGRSDKLYLKQYQQETNLDLVLLVDISGSMGFDGGAVGGRRGGGAGARADSLGGGSPPASQGLSPSPPAHAPSASGGSPPASQSLSRGLDGGDRAVGTRETGTRETGTRGYGAGVSWSKFDCAATCAAALAYAAIGQRDRVGLWLFHDRLVTQTRMSNNREHIRALARVLETAELSDPSAAVGGAKVEPDDVPGRADLGRLFDTVVGKLTQRSLIVLFSDLFDDPALLERGLARLRHRRHDTIVMQVLDPLELTFPFRDPTEFVGLEAEGKLAVDPQALREGYLEALGEQRRAVERLCRRFGFDYLLVDSGEPVGPVLSFYLAQRAARIGKGKGGEV